MKINIKNSLIALLLAIFIVPNTVVARFTDDKEIPVWAESAIDIVEAKRIMTGSGDGSFKPNDSLNRAEAVTLLLRIKDIDVAEYEVKETFSDVPEAAWFAKAVTIAVENEWIKGFPDGTFKPSQELNRAEWAVIVHRAFYFEEEEVSAEYTDVPNSAWFSEAINALHANDLMRRKIGNFGPAVSVTRAEAAWQIATLIQKPRLITPPEEGNTSLRRVAIKPRDFNKFKQGYDIEQRELRVETIPVEEAVSIDTDSTEWINLTSFSVANAYDVNSSLDMLGFKFSLERSGMGPPDSFEIKVTEQEGDFEKIEKFATTGKINFTGLDLKFEPQAVRMFDVSLRRVADTFLYPNAGNGLLSISEASGLTLKEAKSDSIQSGSLVINARINISSTKIANVEFDPTK